MNSKWYVSTLLLIFIYFGAFHQEVSIPNQEIVLEFADTKVNQIDIRNTIDDVRKKLLKVGVSNINIQETKKGVLKISYYSVTNIDNIKEALLEENHLVVNENSDNQEDHNSSLEYKINVYELTNGTHISNQDDSFIFQIKHYSERSTINHNYAFVKNVIDLKTNQLFKTAYKAYKNNPFSKDNTSHKEPEVRAGPVVFNI